MIRAGLKVRVRTSVRVPLNGPLSMVLVVGKVRVRVGVKDGVRVS
jgi:hypothetical protein